MRMIKRNYRITHYQILESVNGEVTELGFVHVEGDPDMFKARKKALALYPDKNVFIGSCETDEVIYKMPVDKFLELADKEEAKPNKK